MAIIYTYPTKTNPTSTDLVLISDSSDGNKTKNAKISSLQGAVAGVSSVNTLTNAINFAAGGLLSINNDVSTNTITYSLPDPLVVNKLTANEVVTDELTSDLFTCETDATINNLAVSVGITSPTITVGTSITTPSLIADNAQVMSADIDDLTVSGTFSAENLDVNETIDTKNLIVEENITGETMRLFGPDTGNEPAIKLGAPDHNGAGIDGSGPGAGTAAGLNFTANNNWVATFNNDYIRFNRPVRGDNNGPLVSDNDGFLGNLQPTPASSKIDFFSEGEWTPSLQVYNASSGLYKDAEDVVGQFSYTTQNGWYTRVNHTVTLHFKLIVNINAAEGGVVHDCNGLKIPGLPFPANNDHGASGACSIYAYSGAGGSSNNQVRPSSSSLFMYYSVRTNPTDSYFGGTVQVDESGGQGALTAKVPLAKPISAQGGNANKGQGGQEYLMTNIAENLTRLGTGTTQWWGTATYHVA